MGWLTGRGQAGPASDLGWQRVYLADLELYSARSEAPADIIATIMQAVASGTRTNSMVPSSGNRS